MNEGKDLSGELFGSVVPCEVCGTEGRIYHGSEETGWVEPCATCEGTGGELVETFPVEMNDDVDFSTIGRYMPERSRPSKWPGGQECMICGCIFIGEEWHSRCAVCDTLSRRPAATGDEG
jgi:hypothetical protein